LSLEAFLLVAELETPAVVVDLDVVERNLSRMADYCRDKNLRLRPHAKTHKIPALAKWQLEKGAQGITVAKIGEGKAEKLAELATRANLTVAVDSLEVADAISTELNRKSANVGILVEIDVG